MTVVEFEIWVVFFSDGGNEHKPHTSTSAAWMDVPKKLQRQILDAAWH